MILKNETIQKSMSGMLWTMKNGRNYLAILGLIMFIGVTSSLMGVGTAIASKNMVDNAVNGDLHGALLAGILFGGLLLFNLGISVVSSLISVQVLEAMSNSMRQKLFSQLMRTEWLAISAYHSGDLLTRLTSDVGTVANCLVNLIPGIVALVAQFVAAFITLLHYEPKLAYLAFLIGPLSVLFSRLWGRKLKQLNIKVKESESAYRSYLQESLQNFLIIKSFQMEERSKHTLQTLHEKRMFWVLKLNHTTLTASTTLGGGFMSSYFLAFSWGAYRLYQKAISFGTLTAFLQLVAQVQGPFLGLARTIPQLISTLASAGRLMELEDLRKEPIADEVPRVNSIGIRFYQTEFAYRSGEAVLDKISAEIRPGEVVALIGTSGEGKTTMIRLLLALLSPDDGKVCFIDSRERTYEVSASTRDWITYVPQGNTLFSGSIADNLRVGKTDASLAEMEQATRSACALSFIKKLPQGFDTIIGENGHGLSEGQAQRIAIARALLRKAPVLILDEATSALDVQSEKQVLNAVREMNCTCLIVTHRPSVQKICSRVFKLQDGGIMEEAI